MKNRISGWYSGLSYANKGLLLIVVLPGILIILLMLLALWSVINDYMFSNAFIQAFNGDPYKKYYIVERRYDKEFNQLTLLIEAPAEEVNSRLRYGTMQKIRDFYSNLRSNIFLSGRYDKITLVVGTYGVKNDYGQIFLTSIVLKKDIKDINWGKITSYEELKKKAFIVFR